MADKKKIHIDIYDTDGELCETIGGRMDADEIIDAMVEALRNEGIPVLREGAKAPIPDKAAKAAMKEVSKIVKATVSGMDDERALSYVESCCEAADENLTAPKGKPLFPPSPWPCNESIKPLPMPLVLRWKVGEIEFSACGDADDVLDAQDEFFEKFPEDK